MRRPIRIEVGSPRAIEYENAVISLTDIFSESTLLPKRRGATAHGLSMIGSNGWDFLLIKQPIHGNPRNAEAISQVKS